MTLLPTVPGLSYPRRRDPVHHQRYPASGQQRIHLHEPHSYQRQPGHPRRNPRQLPAVGRAHPYLSVRIERAPTGASGTVSGERHQQSLRTHRDHGVQPAQHGQTWAGDGAPGVGQYLRPGQRRIPWTPDCASRAADTSDRCTITAAPVPRRQNSFRLYFRGRYGQGRLNFPLFPGTTVDSFDTIVLPGGHERRLESLHQDEFAANSPRTSASRRSRDLRPTCSSTACTRDTTSAGAIVDGFLQTYHGGGDRWDLMASFSELRRGDTASRIPSCNSRADHRRHQPGELPQVRGAPSIIPALWITC